MYDALSALQAVTTVTASNTSSAVSLPTGTPRRGFIARVVVTAISGTAAKAAFKVQHSADNTTFYDLAMGQNEGSGLTAAGEDWIHFETTNPYVRLVNTVTGTSPSVTYFGEIGIAKP